MGRENAWRLLDWEYVCYQAPAVRQRYNRADERAEYGESWFQFVYTETGLCPDVQSWWDSLSADRQLELLNNRLQELRDSVCELEGVL